MEKKAKNKKANMLTAIAATQITGGVFFAMLMGIINLITGGLAMLRNIWSRTAETVSVGFPWVFVIGLIIGGIVVLRGIMNFRTASGYKKVSKAIGDNESISFINLEKRLFWSRKKLLRELGKQTKNGFWPGSYIDMTDEVFIAEYNPIVEKADSGDTVVDEQLDTIGDLIRNMASAGEQIENENLQEQVERLTTIVKQIYSHVEQHPEKAGLVRRLSNYFLPTTVGLLTKYIELQQQAVKTDNMNEAIAKIGEVMDTLEAVFTKHLDALYEEKALDVEVEVEVLQNMAEM